MKLIKHFNATVVNLNSHFFNAHATNKVRVQCSIQACQNHQYYLQTHSSHTNIRFPPKSKHAQHKCHILAEQQVPFLLPLTFALTPTLSNSAAEYPALKSTLAHFCLLFTLAGVLEVTTASLPKVKPPSHIPPPPPMCPVAVNTPRLLYPSVRFVSIPPYHIPPNCPVLYLTPVWEAKVGFSAYFGLKVANYFWLAVLESSPGLCNVVVWAWIPVIAEGKLGIFWEGADFGRRVRRSKISELDLGETLYDNGEAIYTSFLLLGSFLRVSILTWNWDPCSWFTFCGFSESPEVCSCCCYWGGWSVYILLFYVGWVS